MREMLDFANVRSKIPLNSRLSRVKRTLSMSFLSQPANPIPNFPQSSAMQSPCLHPRVQVVSRDEDSEFVECLECREVFDSSEFRDMDIEAKLPTEEE